MSSQLRLPNEIFIAIVHFVHGKKELYALCLCNRLFRDLATPFLYLDHFGDSHLAKHHDLRVLLQHPRFEYIVNTLYTCLSPVNCKKERSIDTLSRSRSSCSCTALDEELGTVLINLRNLKVLNIQCTLCSVPNCDRHQYFVHLKTRVLQLMRLECSCCEAGAKEVTRILGAPCMDSVTSLNLRFSGNRSDDGNRFESFFMDTRVLPNLREIHHHGNRFHHLLLQYRPINRLRASLFCDNNALLTGGGLWKGNKTLTHLHLPWFKLEHLVEIIEQDTNPLRNLQHIGAFYFPASGDDVSLSALLFT
ncbi:hypothetical protein CPB86DRAFT_101505 [Serendipita vermifera]|nr:hypothetical protein CPB86DRAFT_101505 [Serendipita vermifera]